MLVPYFVIVNINQLISHIGIGLMVGGLTLEILMEVVSFYLSTTIDLGGTALKTTKAVWTYFQFRKKINGPFTFAIFTLYTVGFLMLTPEFSLYFSTPVLILIDMSYIPATTLFT